MQQISIHSPAYDKSYFANVKGSTRTSDKRPDFKRVQNGDHIDLLRPKLQKICKDYNNSNTDKIINSHFGEFSQDLVNTISNDVEMFMLDSGDKKGTVKRMFSILVEGLQNIRLHGEKGKEGHQTSFFAIHQGTDSYKIALGNLIYTRHNKNIE